MKFFVRRDVYVPTRLGGVLLIVLLALPGVYWVRSGEEFLSLTERVPAKVLVVEGWVGPEGLAAAKEEFERGGYDLLVTSGGNVDNWARPGWTFAEGAAKQLLRLGLPPEKVVAAPSNGEGRGRTYESAVAVKTALGKSGVLPAAINVFSLGPHSRRSALVYAKAFGSEERVGIIAWEPARYAGVPWWRSSERSIEFLVQTIGYFYELFLNSGRKA